jgi:hypothetical protein
MGRGKDYITKSVMICADQIKKNKMGTSRGMYGIQENCEEGFGGGCDGNRPLKRSRRRWEDNIKMDVKEVGWGGMH